MKFELIESVNLGKNIKHECLSSRQRISRRGFVTYFTFGLLGLLIPFRIEADGYVDESDVSVGNIFLRKKIYNVGERINGRITIKNNTESTKEAKMKFKLLYTGKLDDFEEIEEVLHQKKFDVNLKPNSSNTYAFQTEGSNKKGRHKLYAGNDEMSSFFDGIIMRA